MSKAREKPNWNTLDLWCPKLIVSMLRRYLIIFHAFLSAVSLIIGICNYDFRVWIASKGTICGLKFSNLNIFHAFLSLVSLIRYF